MGLSEGLGRVFNKSITLSKEALLRGVQESFSLAWAHYIMIDLPEMAKGCPKEYSAEELDAIKAEVRAPAEFFANSLLPRADTEADPGAGAGDNYELFRLLF